jgi:hypothetical protein
MANKKITDLMSGTPTRDSLLESATDVGGTMVSRKFKVGAVADVNNVQIASEYDDTATYAYGAYCIKDGVLYRCTTAISVAEAWTVAHWTAVMVTGEYKRVRIMTKAQFDLLSNDEKDGFIYVSDYPTKIQDIDNVTLTTSDNNKLLGVSVSGSDISVGAVEVTADDIPYSTGVSVADKLDTIDETLNKFGFNKIKSQTFTGLTVSANSIDTRDLTLTVPAEYGILCGFSLASTSNCSIMQCYFNSTTTLHTRILNHASNNDQYSIVIFYI